MLWSTLRVAPAKYSVSVTLEGLTTCIGHINKVKSKWVPTHFGSPKRSLRMAAYSMYVSYMEKQTKTIRDKLGPIQNHIRRPHLWLTLAQANAVWDTLIARFGCTEEGRQAFCEALTQKGEDVPTKWPCGLGFFRHSYCVFWASILVENLTPSRDYQLAKVGLMLEALCDQFNKEGWE